MANYLNGSFRGLALGMQFMQNQERILAEKAMQSERIRANDLQLDKRIAADAASQGKTIAFQDRQLSEQGRQFDITNDGRMEIYRAELDIAQRGMVLKEEAAPSQNALRRAQADTLTAQIGENERKLDQKDRDLDQTDRKLDYIGEELVQMGGVRQAQGREIDSRAAVNNENVRVSRESSVNEMNLKATAEDVALGVYVANRIVDSYGGNVDKAMQDPRFTDDLVTVMNKNPGTSLDQFRDRVSNPRWEYVDGRMVIRGENTETGEPTLLTANGLNMFETSDPPLEAEGGDVIFGIMAVAQSAPNGMLSASELRNLAGGGKPKGGGKPTGERIDKGLNSQLNEWIESTGLSEATLAQVDLGGLAMINGARQGDYAGPPMVVAGAEVSPPEIDPNTKQGQQLAKLNRQLQDAEKRKDTGRAQEVQQKINGIHEQVRATAPASAPAQAQAQASAPAPVRELGPAFGENGLRREYGGAPEQQAADSKDPKNTVGVLRAPPVPLSRNLGYDTPELRRALAAQSVHGTGEAVSRAVEGRTLVPETTTEYQGRQITAGINPNNGAPVNTARDPSLLINPEVMPHTGLKLSSAFDNSTLGNAAWINGKKPSTDAQSQHTKAYQAIKPQVIQYVQTPEFFESFAPAQAKLGKELPEDINQWSDATMRQATDWAMQIMPLGTARQVLAANKP